MFVDATRTCLSLALAALLGLGACSSNTPGDTPGGDLGADHVGFNDGGATDGPLLSPG